MSGVLVNTYVYQPLAGIKIHTNPQKLETKYEYDTYGRLTTVKDHQGKILRSNSYHYRKPPTNSNRVLLTVHPPRIETYSRPASSGFELFHAVNTGARYYSNFPSSSFADFLDIINTYPASSLATINFSSATGLNSEVVFDMIQDGSIVATFTQPNQFHSELKLPAGNYTIVVRTGATPYENVDFIRPQFKQTGINNMVTIKTGDMITLNAGVSYNMTVSY